MPDYKLIGHDYTLPDLVGQGDGTGEVLRGHAGRRDAVLPGASQSAAARPGSEHRRERGAEDARRQGHSHARGPAADARRRAVRPVADAAARARRPSRSSKANRSWPWPPSTRPPPWPPSRRSRSTYDPLPFVIDPLESLRPGGPNARSQGNIVVGDRIPELKWTEADFAEAKAGRMPMGQVSSAEQWAVGDLEAGFKEAAVVIDESFVIESTPHIPLETRSAMAYWQNGKLYVHCSTQSLAQTWPAIAQWAGDQSGRSRPHQRVHRRGVRGKEPGDPLRHHPDPARPEDRAAGDDAHHAGRRDGHGADPLGHGRAGEGGVCQGRPDDGARPVPGGRCRGVRLQRPRVESSSGLAALPAEDDAVSRRSPCSPTRWRTGRSAGPACSSFPPLELVMSRAARRLGLDPLAIHRINAPVGKAPAGADVRTAAGAAGHDVQRAAGARPGRRALQVGGAEAAVGQAPGRQGARHRRGGRHLTSPGVTGYDGLLLIKPDGKLYVQSGCGHLGTNSTYDTCRAAAEVLGMPWDKVVVTQGDSSRYLPVELQSERQRHDARAHARQLGGRAWTRSRSCRRLPRWTWAAHPGTTRWAASGSTGRTRRRRA